MHLTSPLHFHYSPSPPRRMNSAADPPSTILDSIRYLLSHLLLSSITTRSFFGRWQLIRPKLTSLLSALVSSASWPQPYHPLLLTLLHNLHSTLHRLKSLADQCASDSPPTRGKLHMQSDLDMASAVLSDHLHHLDLLLRSGVLDQSSAIVLSQPPPGSAKEDIQLFVKDLFTRLQIGGIELKKKALESLLQLLLDDPKSAPVVSREGNVAYLIQLLDPNTHPSIREHAVSAVSILASAIDESRRRVFEEGGLGSLLKVLESGSNAMKEKAAIAVESITADSDNAWAVSAYGGVAILLESCRSGPPATQPHALGAIRNVAAVADVRAALAEEGAIPLLFQLLCSGTGRTRQNAASCVAVFASSGEYFRSQILQERGLRKLMALIQDSPSSEALESALRAIASLAASRSVAKILCSSIELIMQLGQLIRHGIPNLQHVSTSLLANLSMGDRSKRAIASCMSSLIRLMEFPKPVGLQESASQVLVSLFSLKSNSKGFVRDEKSVVRLVQMLDPRNESVPKKLPIAVVAAIISSGNGCRRRLVDAGAYRHMQKLAEMEVSGAKKAAQRLAGNRLKTIFSRTWRENCH